MTRCLLTAFAVLALAATSAFAITTTSTIGEWETAGLLHTATINSAATYTPMSRYGATIQSGRFYAIVEIAKPLSDFSAGSLFPSAYIDVDRNATTHAGKIENSVSELPGQDIDLEYDNFQAGSFGDNPKTTGVYFWGWDYNDGNGSNIKDNWETTNGEKGGPDKEAAGSAHSTLTVGNTTVFAWSVPVDSITTAVANTSPNAIPGTVWQVTLSMNGTPNNTSWGGRSNSVLEGDANRDGTTDATDLNTVLSFYNQTGQTWNTGDFNKDGTTDATDLNTVLSFYNQTTNVFTSGSLLVSNVPEPSSLAMVATLSALMAAWVTARRRVGSSAA